MLFTADLLIGVVKKSSGTSYFLFIIIAAYAAIYFFYLRPRQKKAKAARTQARGVEVGDRAVTIGGLVGTVTSMEADMVTLTTEDGTKLQFLARAIANKYVEPTVADEPDSANDDSSGDQH
jgi:preprotein translocase subunit YajC